MANDPAIPTMEQNFSSSGYRGWLIYLGRHTAEHGLRASNARISPLARDLVGKVAQYSRMYIKLSKTVDLVGRISMSIRRDVGVATDPRTRKAET